MFNLLNRTLVTTLDDAAEAAQKLMNVITPDNSYDIVAIAESFGLGISADLKAKSEAMEVAQLEAEEIK